MDCYRATSERHQSDIRLAIGNEERDGLPAGENLPNQPEKEFSLSSKYISTNIFSLLGPILAFS